MKSTWAVVETDLDNKIFFIEDICHLTGAMSITNDAENVVQHFHDACGPSWRVVYKDTNNEWWEMIPHDHPWCGLDISFEKWHGMAWDKLKGNV
jgi:hypothetical protein